MYICVCEREWEKERWPINRPSNQTSPDLYDPLSLSPCIFMYTYDVRMFRRISAHGCYSVRPRRTKVSVCLSVCLSLSLSLYVSSSTLQHNFGFLTIYIYMYMYHITWESSLHTNNPIISFSLSPSLSLSLYRYLANIMAANGINLADFTRGKQKVKKIEMFQQPQYRKMLGLHFFHHLTKLEILAQPRITKLEGMFIFSRHSALTLITFSR